MSLDESIINPIEWFSYNRSFEEVLAKFECEFAGKDLIVGGEVVGNIDNNFLFITDKCALIKGKKSFELEKGKKYTSFMLYSYLKFDNNYVAAMNSIIHKDFKKDLPFIRVGVDYFKVIRKKDRYGIYRDELKGYTKQTIIDDFGKNAINDAAKFDDFTIWPDNINYRAVVDNCYNLYRRFEWEPVKETVTEKMIPYSMQVMTHIFQEQLEIGLKYMKILYEMPWARFYILCLVSVERNTGKSTFLNWFEILFGDNFVNTNLEELQSQFNGGYCAKNIIAVEEALSDKKLILEKLKALVLLTKLPVNEKYIRNYSIPFYAKFIFASNHEIDFIKIDEEEDRFWVRKIPTLPEKYKNQNILECLKKEIPMFLKYLKQLPEIESTYRFILEPKEVMTENLKLLKLQSKTGLYKDMIERFKRMFWDNEMKEFLLCTPTDIQDQFYSGQKNNIGINYISDVLRKEFKIKPVEKPVKYCKFLDYDIKTTGRPYIIERSKILGKDEYRALDLDMDK